MLDRQNLILDNMKSATIIAQRMYNSLSGIVEFEDIEAYAMLGLIDAVDHYNPEKYNNTFSAYSTFRIRGYIIDELRRNDFLKRTGRAQVKANQREDVYMLDFDAVHISIPFPDNATKIDLEIAVNKLPLIERKVIYYHYVMDIQLNKISDLIGNSTQKTVAIHRSAINRLRAIFCEK